MGSEDFSAFYRKEIFPIQKRFKNNQKQTVLYTIKISFLFFILCSGSTLLLVSRYSHINVPCCVIGGIIICVFSGIKAYHSRRLPREKIFFEEIFPLLVKYTAPSLSYDPFAHVPLNIYRTSLLFRTQDRLSGSDFVSGYNQGVKQGFSWLHAEYCTLNNKKNEITWHNIFKGILFYADFNKNFHGTVLIVPDRLSSLFGSHIGQFIQKITWRGIGNQAFMENPEFEKIFTVYTTDQIEARYILTPHLMQELISLSKAIYFDEMSISFNHSTMFIAFYTEKSPFLYNGQDLSENLIYDYFQKILFFTSITDKLNLNIRIWTKK